MPSWADFFRGFDLWGLLDLLVTAMACLFCITFHEVSHGMVAWKLGDQTAKKAGRLSLNPVRHIDVIGLLMMLAVGVGWAKPVPVDPRNFKDPKRGMALTALAGPVSNILLTTIALLAVRALVHLPLSVPLLVVICLLSNVAVLSIGLGIFNLFPVPPLDGSKILAAALPEGSYRKLLRYERFGMILVVALFLTGVLERPISLLISHALSGLCSLTGCPLMLVYSTLDLSLLLG